MFDISLKNVAGSGECLSRYMYCSVKSVYRQACASGYEFAGYSDPDPTFKNIVGSTECLSRYMYCSVISVYRQACASGYILSGQSDPDPI